MLFISSSSKLICLRQESWRKLFSLYCKTSWFIIITPVPIFQERKCEQLNMGAGCNGCQSFSEMMHSHLQGYRKYGLGNKIQVLYLMNHKMYLKYKQKVSLLHKIPKIWFSKPDTDPKICSEPVSQYALTLLI